MRLAIPARDDAAGWRRWFVAAMLMMLALHVIDIFVRPSLAGVGDLVIQDDARQFLSWMPRLVDPNALHGDWLADFWAAMSPAAYQAIYRAGAALGIVPTDMARLVSVTLLGVSGAGAWRLGRAMCPDPRVAFVAAAFVMAYLSKEDSIFSATPRGVAVPIILFFLEALVRQRWVALAVSAAALTLVYPAPAITLFTMLGLSRLSLKVFPPFAGGWSDMVKLSAIGILIVGIALLFREQTEAWGPVLTLDEARRMPALMTPLARSTIVNAEGRIDYLCSMRTGFLPEMVRCGHVPFAWAANLLLLMPLLWLGWRGLRSGGRQRVYALTVVAAALWFVAAWLVAFRLHLPSRYSQRVLSLLEWLALGQLIGGWLTRRPEYRHARVAAGFTALCLAAAFATPLARLQRPSDRSVIDQARAMPAGVRIGGVSEDLTFLPALAGRAITGSTEHAVPWETGYYRRIARGLADDLRIVSTGDAAELKEALTRSQADYLLVSDAVLLRGEIPESYRRTLPVEAEAASARLAERPPVLARLAARCRQAESRYIDVRCLLAELGLRGTPAAGAGSTAREGVHENASPP